MTWRELNRWLLGATEDECLEALAAERAGPRRRAFLIRIHARFDKLRRRREREELTREAIGR